MKRITILTIIIACVGINLSSQNTTEKKSFKDKLYTGGSLGLTFGSYTNVMISPMLGARLNERLYAGLGIEYQYTKDKRYEPALTYNQFGGRIFSQYSFIPQLFAHVEFAAMSMERYNLQLKKERNFVPFLYVGGGFRQRLAGNSFVSFRILFDVLQNQNSPYNSWEPIYSIGFGVGL